MDFSKWKRGNLVINKIGTPLLDDSYEDINEIITKEDVEKIKNETEIDEDDIKPNEHSSYVLSTKTIIAFAGGAGGLILIVLIIFMSCKCCKKKEKLTEDNNKDEGLVPGGF